MSGDEPCWRYTTTDSGAHRNSSVQNAWVDVPSSSATHATAAAHRAFTACAPQPPRARLDPENRKGASTDSCRATSEAKIRYLPFESGAPLPASVRDRYHWCRV